MTIDSRTPATQDPWSVVTPIAGLVGALSVAFFIIRIMVKRRKPSTMGRSHHGHLFKQIADGVDENDRLPDDPAAALAELKRRADAN